MSAISTYLEYIRSKIYAKDVRTAIVNAISQCYDDVNAPALQTEAMQAAVQAKIDAGQMAALTIGDRTITEAKLALGVIPTPDTTLSQSGVPADAKKTGDEISAIKADLGNYEDITASRSHNILPYESTSVVVNNVNVDYRNGKITVNGTANNSGGRLTKIAELTLSAGEYGWYYSTNTLAGVYIEKASDNTLISSETISGRFKKFTLTEETAVYIGVGVTLNSVYAETIEVMVSDDITKLYWLAPVQSAKDEVARTKIDKILSDPYYVKATPMPLEWESGGITSNGNYNTNTNRLRTKYIIPVPLKMAVSENYRFVCAQYDKELNFIANYPSAFVAEVLPSDLNPSTAYIRFVLKRTDDASISISEGSNLIATGIEEDNINTKKDINLAIYGDSISTYTGWIPSGNRVEYSGSTHGVTNVNQTWWKKVIDYFGYNLVMNNSWSGRCVSTIRDTESGNINSGGCEQANIDVIGSNGTPDVIIVEMGTNDINRANILGLGVWSGNPVGNVSNESVTDSELTSFAECYARMLYRIHDTYPEAIIYCCTVMQQKRASLDGWPQITLDDKTLSVWNDKIREIADITGCRIIDFASCGNTYFNADIVFGDGATHPNGIGFLNMFNVAKKALSD